MKEGFTGEKCHSRDGICRLRGSRKSVCAEHPAAGAVAKQELPPDEQRWLTEIFKAF